MKSTPVIVNGGRLCVLFFGSGAGLVLNKVYYMLPAYDTTLQQGLDVSSCCRYPEGLRDCIQSAAYTCMI